MFFDLSTNEDFNREASEEKKNVLKVGKYIFSQYAFHRVIEIIKYASLQNGWLIIDEVSLLELSGEGLSEVVLYSLKTKGNTIFVTRESLEEQVIPFGQALLKVFYSIDEFPE